MYMVPNIAPAPSAAMMPVAALPGVPAFCCAVATASTAAPDTIANAPPTTLAQSLAPDPRSSLKSRQPHARPTRLFMFHNGNAMARPTFRTPKTVSVLPTAHSIPASSAHTIRCGFSRRSLNRNPVPFSSVGTVQRATNAPITIPMEMMKGENPAFTSLVGASALPSQTAADSPQNTPSLCNEIVDRTPMAAVLWLITSPQRHQQRGSQNQHDHRHPKMHVGQDGHPARSLQASTSVNFTGRFSSNDLRAAIAMITGTRLSAPVTGTGLPSSTA